MTCFCKVDGVIFPLQSFVNGATLHNGLLRNSNAIYTVHKQVMRSLLPVLLPQHLPQGQRGRQQRGRLGGGSQVARGHGLVLRGLKDVEDVVGCDGL